MAADHFCLKWNNFQSSIITAFESLQTTEDLADVTLTCDGISVKGHKIILSAFSTYFRTVFKENPCHHPIVILKGVTYADLIAILHFMYHGEVLILKDQLPSFLQTAKLLQVSGLASCGDFHIKNVTQKFNNKTPKPMKPKDTTEPLIKKSKIVKKPSSPSHNVEVSNICKSTTTTPPKTKEINTEVGMDKIKTEIEDGDEDVERYNSRNINISEAIVESQPSILERSLMSISHQHAKPNMAYQEQTNAIQLAADLSKSFHICEKPPELLQESEKHHLEPYIELNCVESDKGEDKMKEFDSPLVHKDMGLMQDVPHHSSQCGNCPHCGKIYSNQSALKYHVRLVHSDLTNMYCCHLCPEAFDYRENYKRHMIDMHNVRN